MKTTILTFTFALAALAAEPKQIPAELRESFWQKTAEASLAAQQATAAQKALDEANKAQESALKAVVEFCGGQPVLDKDRKLSCPPKKEESK
jgi:hypothetical protein